MQNIAVQTISARNRIGANHLSAKHVYVRNIPHQDVVDRAINFKNWTLLPVGCFTP